MPVSIHTNLELLSWNEFVSLKLYAECMPLNTLKNRYQRLKETRVCGACNSAKGAGTQAELTAKPKEQKVL